MLTNRINEIKKSNYIKSILVLVSGTACAQAIMILVLPLLTRLYAPEDFSILAVYAAILGITSVSACLRLDIAIPIPEHDTDAANLLAISLISSASISLLAGVFVFLFPHEIARLTAQPELIHYLWLLPFGIALSSSYSALQFWATRKKRFSTIASSRLEQSISGASTQIGFGWIGYTPLGLVLGQILSSGAGIIRLGRSAFSQDQVTFKSISLSEMRRLFKAYDNFPKYSTLDALANTIGIQLPIIIIASVALGSEAGCLMLAMKVLQAPLGLLGSAIAQVYLARGPSEHREGNLAEFTSKTLNGLIKSGAGPLIFAGIVAPDIFSLVFGEEWRRAGVLAAWMTPWIVFQFISSPISMVMHIVNRQRLMLGLTLWGLFLRVGSVAAAVYLDSAYVSECYALSGAVFYIVCFRVFTAQAGVGGLKYISTMKGAIPLICGWATLGITFSYIFNELN